MGWGHQGPRWIKDVLNCRWITCQELSYTSIYENNITQVTYHVTEPQWYVNLLQCIWLCDVHYMNLPICVCFIFAWCISCVIFVSLICDCVIAYVHFIIIYILLYITYCVGVSKGWMPCCTPQDPGWLPGKATFTTFRPAVLWIPFPL